MTETRSYEPVRLSTPPNPLFSLQPLDATTWLRSLLSNVLHTNMADVTSFEDLFPIIHSVSPPSLFSNARNIWALYVCEEYVLLSGTKQKRGLESVSSTRFLNSRNEHIKTAQLQLILMDETGNLSVVDIMNSKRQVKGKLGYMIQLDICGLL